MTNKQIISLLNKIVKDTKRHDEKCFNINGATLTVCGYDTNEISLRVQKFLELEKGVYVSEGKKFIDFGTVEKIPGKKFEVTYDLPSSKNTNQVLPVSINSNELKRAAVYSSLDKNRYILHGVYLDKDKNNIVATDGRRLIQIPFKCDELEDSIIIHYDVIKLLPKDVMLNIRASRKLNRVAFTWTTNNRTFILSSKLIEGIYPNYKQVIPKDELPNLIHLNNSFKDYVKSFGVKQAMRMQFTKEQMNVGPSNTEKTKVFCYDENPVIPENDKIALNPRFALDMMATGFDSFEFKDELSPAVAKDNSGAIAVVMPLRR